MDRLLSAINKIIRNVPGDIHTRATSVIDVIGFLDVIGILEALRNIYCIAFFYSENDFMDRVFLCTVEAIFQISSKSSFFFISLRLAMSLIIITDSLT